MHKVRFRLHHGWRSDDNRRSIGIDHNDWHVSDRNSDNYASGTRTSESWIVMHRYKLLPAGAVFLPGDSRQEGRDAGHQHIHSRKCPAVLMSCPFVPINGTFINFVGRYMLQGLPLDLQGIKLDQQMTFKHAARTR